MAESRRNQDETRSSNRDGNVKEPSRRGRKLRLITVGLLITLVVIAVTLFLDKDEAPPNDVMLRHAVELIDDRDNPMAIRRAMQIAHQLAEVEYQDPELTGMVDFILGIGQYREAESQDETVRERIYAEAIEHLREAERRALGETWEAERAFALGMSLYRTGLINQAQPLLEQAINDYPDGRIEATLALSDILVLRREPAELQRALELNRELLASHELIQTRIDQAYFQQARILMELGQITKANEAISHVSPASSKDNRSQVLRAQMLMAKNTRESLQQAMETLEPVADDTGLDQSNARQAAYLKGVCAEDQMRLAVAQLNQARDQGTVAQQRELEKEVSTFSEAAIIYYEETARRFEKSQEALAASLRAAQLLQAADRREDALDAYQAALKLLGNPEVYRNQWISIEEFERIVLDARNEWVSQGRFEEAIVLSRSLTPLLPAIQALELSARANQQWAEYLQETYDTATYIRQVELKSELRDRWRQSGKSFDELAEVLRTSRRYPEALWTSAEHFRRGHDFSNALEQLVRFIDTKPARLLPTAITARGEVLMDLDRLPEAVEQFERVIEEFPTDAAAFEAEFLLGRCAMEMGDTKRAAGIWTGILDSSVLAPAANEWRLSLFWLGRLKYEQAEISHSQAEGILLAGGAAEAAKPQFRQAYLLWEEAARLLEEYVRRYPSTRERVEARYFLAKSLQNNAYRLQRDLEAARTDNARVELQRTARGLLADAAQEFLGLQEDLFILQERGRLDPIAQRVLQLSYFEHANVYYALGQYDKAIQEYNRALHRYPNSPQVLMAYTQMTNCYDHLSRPGDARIILEQARVVLNQMGPNSFDPQMTNLSKDEWDSWLQRARRLH